MELNLLCCEGETMKRAFLDPVFLKDIRVLKNLMKLEDFYTLSANYMDYQQDVKPFMRKMVTEWMLEVCEEQRCEEEVFALAVNFMDRFLASYRQLKRGRLQLLATACMFLASKLKENEPLPAEKLVIYTDHSITLQELLDWELLVVCKLKWDLNAVIPIDFLDLFIHRLSIPSEFLPQVRRHALVNIDMCSLEYDFSIYPPSMIAAASIAAALEVVLHHRMATQCIQSLHRIAGVEMDCLRSCQEYIQRLSRNQSPDSGIGKDDMDSSRGTPTDVLDVELV